MTLRNLALASLIALASCAGPNMAYADDPACDIANRSVTIEAAAAKQNLPVTKLDAGQTQAFNAELAKAHGVDVKDMPEMNSLDVVIVPAQDGENLALVFGFKDGCFVGAAQITEQEFKSIQSRTQA